MLPLALSIFLRVSLVLGVALAVALVARRASAAFRRLVLALGFGAALAVPLVVVALPRRPLVAVLPTPSLVHVVAEALVGGGAPPADARASVGAPAGSRRVPWEALAFATWALGAGVVVARLVAGAARGRRLVGRARPGPLGELVSGEVEVPVVVGWLVPKIVLPEAAARWSDERLRAVLLHERAHQRSRDGLVLAVAELGSALYWVHPLSWLSRTFLRRECELAADEAVLRSGLKPSRYAEHLLDICRSLGPPTTGIAMAGRPSELRRRVERLVSRDRVPSPPSRRETWLSGALALFVLGVAACAGAAPAVVSAPRTVRISGAEPALRAMIDAEAERARRESGARRVVILVLDARSGRLLAEHDDDPQKLVLPGSTLKPITVALALDAGRLSPDDRFDCGHGQRTYGDQVLRDAGSYGVLSVREILAVSSNVGLSRVFDRLGGERLVRGLGSFRLSAPRDVEDGSLAGAIVAMGQRVPVRPADLAAAYTVFANEGRYVAAPGGEKRVIRPETARTVLSMLEGVVTAERGTGRAAALFGVRVAGKTGTSDSDEVFASFVGIVPVDAPRFVILTGLSGPKLTGGGGTLAAPLFRRVALRALGAR